MAEDERLELSHAFTWTVFKTGAVPIMLNPPSYGGAKRVRTADPLRAKQVLSQLSYSPICFMSELNWLLSQFVCYH